MVEDNLNMEKTKQIKNSSGGRPLSYDPDLVYDIITTGLADGISVSDLDASYVKEKLCKEHGVADTIRKEKLESLVVSTHAEIAEAKNQALLASLPQGISAAVSDAMAATERELMLVVAHQHSASQAMAAQKCEELRSDKRNAQYRISDLQSELAEEQAARKKVEEERELLFEELAKVREDLRIARTDMERINSEPAGVDRLLAELRDPKIRDDIRATLSDIIVQPAPPGAN